MHYSLGLVLALCSGTVFGQTAEPDRVADASELLIPARDSKGKWGYQDRAGTFVIAPQFAHANSFSDGLALVYTTWGMNLLGKTEGVWLFARAGYIDHAGKFVIKPRLVENARDFSEGLAAFEPGASSWGTADWGYLDKTGKWAIKPQFAIAGEFSEGLAPVAVRLGKKTGNEPWGYIDHTGKFVIPAQFYRANAFRDGIAVVFTKAEEPPPLTVRRCIDKQGSFVKCPQPKNHQNTRSEASVWPTTGSSWPLETRY